MHNKEMIKKQLQHKTIREFKDARLDPETLDLLLEVARRTATSNGLQAFSIIHVTDDSKKQEIAKVCKQDYVANMPELLIFIADQYRNQQILQEKAVDSANAHDMDRFFQAFTDAAIAAQNVVNAAEAMDLGTVYLGSILNDAERICDLLNLPPYTFPVLGLGLGYPAQEPQLKPRFSNSLRIFTNSYKVFDSYLESIQAYDQEMTSYYDLRDANRRVDSFSEQLVAKITNHTVKKRQDIAKVIAKQGFRL